MRFPRSLLGIALLALASPATAAPIVFSASGADPAAIQATVDAYRDQLGTLNPNVAGSFGSGRREINWDGVPDAFSAPNNLPPDFFNVNSPRGAVFSTPGSAVQVSANAGVAPVEFATINPTYDGLFQTFSPQRLFTAVDSNVVEVNFFVPGTDLPAAVSGFGAVFTDVDLPNVTSIEYFDVNGNSLGTFFAPAQPAAVGNEGLSFLGVFFDAGEQVGKVRITSGNSPLGPNEGGGIDLVVMDDFIYGEPTAVPEPGGLALLALGGFGLAGGCWLRRRGLSNHTAR